MADVDAFYRKIKLRLVESGDWDRMKTTIGPMLNGSGWLDDIKHQGVERAHKMDQLSFQTLFEEMSTAGHIALPLSTRREVQALIREYLERQFE
jgi:enhancer of yellow 2 transcription factor